MEEESLNITLDWKLAGNITDNVTSPSPGGGKEMTTGDYVMLVGYLIICTCGLAGNGVCMAVVIYNKSMKTMSNIFIFNLALTDFLFLLSLPFTASVMMTGQWTFGAVMCKIHYTLYGINVYAGVYTLVLMSLDRYVAICCTRWHNYRTVFTSIICCAVVWLSSISLLMPLLLYSSYDAPIQSCYLNWPTYGPKEENDSAPAFAIYTLLLGFAIPVIMICIFYSLIIAKLRSHEAKTKYMGRNQKRTRHVTMLVMAVILAYLICWTPYWTIQIYLLAKGKDVMISEGVLVVVHCTTMLHHTNNALNPLLYGFFSNNFRKGAKAMFNCSKDPSIQAMTNHAVSKASHLTKRPKAANGQAQHAEIEGGPEKWSLLPTVNLSTRRSITRSMFDSRDNVGIEGNQEILAADT